MSSQATSITGGQKSIKKIVSVVANVNLPDGTNSAYSKNVILQAIDKNGKTVPDVVISPETVRVTVPINLATSTKTVPLLLEAGAGGVSNEIDHSSRNEDGSQVDFFIQLKGSDCWD